MSRSIAAFPNFVVTVAIAALIRGDLEPVGQVRSIAVLPFDNLSGSANDQYIVSGFKVELV